MTALPGFCQAAGQAMGQGNGQGHIFGGVFIGIAKHHPLVPRPRAGLAASPYLQGAIDTQGNIGRLFIDGRQDGA